MGKHGPYGSGGGQAEAAPSSGRPRSPQRGLQLRDDVWWLGGEPAAGPGDDKVVRDLCSRGLEPGWCRGRIKPPQPGRSYVLSECPEVRTKYGRHAVLYREKCNADLAEGMLVNFRVEVDRQGRPTARDVAVQLSDTSEMGWVQPGEAADVPEGGTVAEWHEECGYGFLTMANGRRVYIHRSSFGGIGSLEVGAGLQVTTRPDPCNPGRLCVKRVVAGLQGQCQRDWQCWHEKAAQGLVSSSWPTPAEAVTGAPRL